MQRLLKVCFGLARIAADDVGCNVHMRNGAEEGDKLFEVRNTVLSVHSVEDSI